MRYELELSCEAIGVGRIVARGVGEDHRKCVGWREPLNYRLPRRLVVFVVQDV